MILIPTKKKNNNILYFDNDEAFYNWCVVPQLKTCEYTDNLGNIKYFVDFDFTHEYLDAIAKGLRFIIKDEDSQICKHKAVSYRTITKNIDNLDNYYADLYED